MNALLKADFSRKPELKSGGTCLLVASDAQKPSLVHGSCSIAEFSIAGLVTARRESEGYKMAEKWRS